MKSVSTPPEDADDADVFHTTITKELFICKRERHNIEPEVPLMCTGL